MTASDAPIRIIRSTDARLLMRLEMTVPMMKPSGTMAKYNPNSVAGRCRSSHQCGRCGRDDQERAGGATGVDDERAESRLTKEAEKAGEHGRTNRGPVLRPGFRNEEIGPQRDGEARDAREREDRSPAELVDQDAADTGRQQPADGEKHGEIGDRLDQAFGAVHVAGDGPGQGNATPGADGLHQPANQQDGERTGQGRDQASQQKESEADQQYGAASVAVRERTVGEGRECHSEYADAERELRQCVGKLEIDLDDRDDREEQVNCEGAEQRQCCQDQVQRAGEHVAALTGGTTDRPVAPRRRQRLQVGRHHAPS